MVTDAVLTVKRPGKPLDILMIEQMEMITKDAMDSRLVRGLVWIIHIVIIIIGNGSWYSPSWYAKEIKECLYFNFECLVGIWEEVRCG